MLGWKRLWGCRGGRALGAAAASLVAATVANGETTPPLPGVRSCAVWDVDYSLAARIQLTNTPFGAGDGIYPAGPGRLTLRFQEAGADVSAQLRSYRLDADFTVTASALFWKAKVRTRARSTVTPDAIGVAARGSFRNGKLSWTTKVRGYRTDGTTTCSGSGCSLPGAPRPGTRPLRTGPEDIQFRPFTFDSPALNTFQMEAAIISQTRSPRQTTRLSLSGRRIAQRCISPRLER